MRLIFKTNTKRLKFIPEIQILQRHVTVFSMYHETAFLLIPLSRRRELRKASVILGYIRDDKLHTSYFLIF